MKIHESDQEYIEARSALIPIAVQHANQVAGIKPTMGKDLDRWNETWNLAYHTKMNELWEHKKKVTGGRG
jgi:hypothetical protein